MSSDVLALKQGIVKTSKNKANTPCTVLLVGESGVGKSSLVKFITSTLHGKDVDHYNLDIFDEGAVSYQDQTPPHLYDITSNNGVLVSANAFEHGVQG